LKAWRSFTKDRKATSPWRYRRKAALRAPVGGDQPLLLPELDRADVDPALLGQLADCEKVGPGHETALLILDGKAHAALDLVDLGQRVAQGEELADQLPFLDGRRRKQVRAARQGGEQPVVDPLFQLRACDAEPPEQLLAGEIHVGPFRPR
jgi:hypothetical protein